MVQRITPMDPGVGLDASAWFIGKINYVLDRSDFKEQMVRMIPKAENTSEHKDQSDQSNAINNMTSNTVRAIKAIKAMWSTIRPAIRSEQSKQSKRCDQRYDQQYGQSNQSNMVSNTIKTNPEVVTLSLTLIQRPETQAISMILRTLMLEDK